MKKSILLLILLIPVISFSQRTYNADEINTVVDSLRSSIVEQSEYNSQRVFQIPHLSSGTGYILYFGHQLEGYSFNVFDTSNLSSLAIIEEYQDSLLHGKRIQFFDFPEDTASVENYRFGKLDGDIFYRYKNGKYKMRGTYKNDILTDITNWSEEGFETKNDCTYDDSMDIFLCASSPCNGHQPLYYSEGYQLNKKAADLYFTDGKLDSASFFQSYGYWGKPISEISVDYHDSVRTYINYYGPSGNVHWIYEFKISQINTHKRLIPPSFISGIDNDNYSMHGRNLTFYDKTGSIKSQGQYSNEQKCCTWKHFSEKGELIEVEELKK